MVCILTVQLFLCKMCPKQFTQSFHYEWFVLAHLSDCVKSKHHILRLNFFTEVKSIIHSIKCYFCTKRCIFEVFPYKLSNICW